MQSRCLSKSRRLSPSELRLVSEQLFEQVGPLLWPDHMSKRPSWLVEAEVNNFDGLYPVDLCFSVDDHRAKYVGSPLTSIQESALTISQAACSVLQMNRDELLKATLGRVCRSQ